MPNKNKTYVKNKILSTLLLVNLSKNRPQFLSYKTKPSIRKLRMVIHKIAE